MCKQAVLSRSEEDTKLFHRRQRFGTLVVFHLRLTRTIRHL
jgi:hypothetical protein